MSFATAFFTYLHQQPELRERVGDRIYPVIAPQAATLPYLTWFQLSNLRTYHFTGRSNLKTCTAQIDCWAATYPEIDKLATAIEAVADRKHQGDMPELDVRRMAIINEIDVSEIPDDGGQYGVFHRAIDVEIWYREV